MKHQETYRHEAAATATALAPITEETLQARSRENKAKVADLRQQLEKMELTGPTDLSTHLDDYLYGDR